jgi:Ca2+-binding EF-hand superfamily protein
MLQINEFYEFWLDTYGEGEEADLSHLFEMLDEDGNGNVSANEYLGFMEDDEHAEPLDDFETTALTNIILDQDTDGNGELNLTEFGAFLDALEFELYDDYEMAMFGIDTDHNGTVSLTELSEGFLSGNDEMANNTRMSTFFSNLFNYSDVDSDQELNSSEFEEFYIELDK